MDRKIEGDELDRLGERIAAEGLREGETLRGLVQRCRRLIVEATVARCPTRQEAANQLGITREALYKYRRRYGLDVAERPEARAIPEDWRERLAG